MNNKATYFNAYQDFVKKRTYDRSSHLKAQQNKWNETNEKIKLNIADKSNTLLTKLVGYIHKNNVHSSLNS